MVFGNEYTERQIPEWKFDDSVRAIVEKALSSQFDIKQIAIPVKLRGSFDQLRGSLLTDGREENAPILSKLLGDKTCKYFLLVAAAGSQFGSSNQAVGGLGVVEAESLFGNTRYVHAVAQARIFDGKTYAFLDWKNLRTGQNIFTDSIQGPHQEIDAKAHPSLQAVADDPKTREILLSLLDESLKETLPAMLAVDKPDALTGSLSKQQGKKGDDWAPF